MTIENSIKFILSTALLFALISAIPVKTNSVQQQLSRLDCLPERGANEEKCLARGCLWSPVNEEKETGKETASIQTPWCYFPDSYIGYEVMSGSDGFYQLRRNRPSGLPDDIQLVAVSIEEVGANSLRIRIYDEQNSRYEPVLPKLNLPKSTTKESSEKTFHYDVTSNSHLVVTRKSTGAVIFETDLRKLIFANQFIQLNSKLNSQFVYGLGEHFDTFLKKSDRWRPYNLFTTDDLPMEGGTRSYGVFPFYINLDSDLKSAHGVYLKNSNAMDIILQPDQSVTFRPVGGILDFIIFGGPTPHDVVAEYQNMVGLPDLPPRWGLGFHLCRYGYNSLENTKEAWQRTRDAGIPFDVQWNDIDYMDRHNDFTYDPVHYKGLPEFVDHLHSIGMKYIILFDPGLSKEDNYEPYSLGMDMDIFIKDSEGEVIVGEVWNDSKMTIFPDFSNPKSVEYWSKLFKDFHDVVAFDGAWLDMNDISSFVDGSKSGCPSNASSIDSPPYEPGFYPLIKKTLCMSARHKDGLEYDVHSLYSFYETIATFKALQEARPNTRPFIISRSTSVGQGHYGGHWNGDLLSQWNYLKWTIPSIIEHSMYGYAMMGADICGFEGNTNVELCARWHTLGSFYTFTRNHNNIGSIDQDPVALGPVVVQAARDSLLKKYSLLPYLYSLIHRAHMFGEPIIRGVPFEFFPDQGALEVEDQFLWGQALMISPIVEQNTYSKLTYLSAGRWYETGVELNDKPKLIHLTEGTWHKTDDVALTEIPLFYRGGNILPVYEEPKLTIEETVKQPLSLLVALCDKGRAFGEVYLDHGDNVDGKYNHAHFIAKQNTLYMIKDRHDIDMSTPIGKVRVLGIDNPVKYVLVNQKKVDFNYSDGELKFSVDSDLSKDNLITAEWFL